MKVYNVDYTLPVNPDEPVQILSIIGYNSDDDAAGVATTEGATRAQFRSAEGLALLNPDVLLAIRDFKAKKGQIVEPTAENVWNLFVTPPKKKHPEGLQSPLDTAKSPSDGNGAVDEGKTKMAKAKKASKKKVASKAKKTDGLPREGTKGAKLLALILRSGGATFAEMAKATGWKEMRGTASELAVRAGKKLTIIKEEGKAPRWQAK